MQQVETEVLTQMKNKRRFKRCPTCRGQGSIPKVHSLLALIPLNDERLRQRRPHFWIIFIGLFLSLISLTVIFVIYPRDVNISIENPKLIDGTNDSFRNESIFRLTFKNQISIRSLNYLPVRLINVSTNIEHHLISIKSNIEPIQSNRIYLNSFGRTSLDYQIYLDFNNETMVYQTCHETFRQLLVFKLKIKLIYTDFLVARLRSAENDFFQYVLCSYERKRDWTNNGSLKSLFIVF